MFCPLACFQNQPVLRNVSRIQFNCSCVVSEHIFSIGPFKTPRCVLASLYQLCHSALRCPCTDNADKITLWSSMNMCNNPFNFYSRWTLTFALWEDVGCLKIEADDRHIRPNHNQELCLLYQPTVLQQCLYWPFSILLIATSCKSADPTV